MNMEQIKELKTQLDKLEGMQKQKEVLSSTSKVQFLDDKGRVIITMRGEQGIMYTELARTIIEERVKEKTANLKANFGLDIDV